MPLVVLGVMVLNHCHPIDAANDDTSGGVGSSILDGRFQFTSDVTQYLNLAYDAAELDETEEISEKLEIYKIVSYCSTLTNEHVCVQFFPCMLLVVVVIVVLLSLSNIGSSHFRIDVEFLKTLIDI